MESDSGEEDNTLFMGNREWQKMSRDMTKQGYRDGITEGREKGRQKSFEAATGLGLKYGLKLGQLLGIIEWKLSQTREEKQKEKLRDLREKIASQLALLKNCPEEIGGDGGGRLEEELCTEFHKLGEQVLSLLKLFSSEQTIIKGLLTK